MTFTIKLIENNVINSAEKKDKTRIAEHYDNNGKLCKRKYEFDDYCCEETPESTDYYTKDGFKYLTIQNQYTLIDRLYSWPLSLQESLLHQQWPSL